MNYSYQYFWNTRIDTLLPICYILKTQKHTQAQACTHTLHTHTHTHTHIHTHVHARTPNPIIDLEHIFLWKVY